MSDADIECIDISPTCTKSDVIVPTWFFGAFAKFNFEQYFNLFEIFIRMRPIAAVKSTPVIESANRRILFRVSHSIGFGVGFFFFLFNHLVSVFYRISPAGEIL